MSAVSPVRLSIVTVCWNDLTNVQRTMESLVWQKERQGWEHILIDGASTDGTAQWYESMEFDVPHRFISEPDNGIFDAMNKSLDLVNGDYVVFMNAGDRYTDDGGIGRLLRRIESAPEWGYSRARTVDDTGRKVRPDIGRIPYSRISHLFGIAKLCHQTVVMRLDFLRDLGGFDLRMGNGADYHLLLKAASRELPVTWPDVDVDYLAGGVSDAGIYDSLWLGHRSRVDALDMKAPSRWLDAGWTSLQVAQIYVRKKLKPLLGPIYLRIRG